MNEKALLIDKQTKYTRNFLKFESTKNKYTNVALWNRLQPKSVDVFLKRNCAAENDQR
jgi:hypothetical protein